MRSLATALFATLILAACSGGDSTAPDPDPPQLGAVNLDIVSGDAQSDTVLSLLGDPVTVLAYRDAGTSALHFASGVSAQTTEERVPVAGQVVNFVVIDSACGRPFAGSAVTDSTGRVLERWELGTKAGECRMEARAVDQETGEAIVFDTATATVLPGVVDTLNSIDYGLVFPSESFTAAGLASRAVDSHGNIVSDPDVSVEGRANATGWTIDGADVTAPATEGEATFMLLGGNDSSSVKVSVSPDLGARTWVASGACVYPHRTDSPADSMVYTVTTDSITYVAISGALKDHRPRLYTHGSEVWYRQDGSVDTTAVSPALATAHQAADSLVWMWTSPNQADYLSLRTDTDPVTYEGGRGLCGGILLSYRPWQMVAQ